MTEKKPQFSSSEKFSNKIQSVTESIKFARGPIVIQRHDVTNDVIMT